MEVVQAALVPSGTLERVIRESLSENPQKMFNLGKLTVGLSRSKLS